MYKRQGFSFTGATIAAGSGVLTILDVDGDVSSTCLSGLVISDSNGNALDATVEGCTTISVDGGSADVYGCTDSGACNYDSDATADDGSCDYGTVCWDGSTECNADDCPDTPGGTVEVNFESDIDIAGFQFEVDGVSITGASGGAAEAAGFTVSTSSSTVLGFSFTGATIAAGSGVLTILDVQGDISSACLSGLVVSDSNGESLDAMVEGCTTISVGGGSADVYGCTDSGACNYDSCLLYTSPSPRD